MNISVKTLPVGEHNYAKPLLLCDENTRTAMTGRLAGYAELCLSNPHADIATANEVIKATSVYDGIIAAGSGTINDLAKYAAKQLGISHISFPTAPSMNGYISPTASLEEGGYKKSFPAQRPVALWLDYELIANAPMELITAGVGDAFCRATVQADMLLAHLLVDADYDESFFTPLLADEKWLFSNPDKIKNRDVEAIRRLMNMLLLGGEAMFRAGSSAPASQGEHMIAHLMESRLPDLKTDNHQPPTILHGHQIAVTTLYMLDLQQKILASDMPLQLIWREADEAGLSVLIGQAAAAKCLALYAKKGLTPERIAQINSKLQAEWAGIRQRFSSLRGAQSATWQSSPDKCSGLLRHDVPRNDVEHFFSVIGLPTKPEQLGWDTATFHKAAPLAALTRDRFTFLDLLTF